VARLQQVIYLGILSKLIGRNIRVGWLIAPPNIVAKLAEMRQYIDAGLSILPQLLAEQYLLYHHQRHYKMLIQQLRHKAEQLQQWLKIYFDGQFTYIRLQGELFLYLQLPVINRHKEQQKLNELLSKKVSVAPGRDFGDRHGTLRLNFAHFDWAFFHK